MYNVPEVPDHDAVHVDRRCVGEGGEAPVDTSSNREAGRRRSIMVPQGPGLDDR